MNKKFYDLVLDEIKKQERELERLYEDARKNMNRAVDARDLKLIEDTKHTFVLCFEALIEKIIERRLYEQERQANKQGDTRS